jgi:hypothetical protein
MYKFTNEDDNGVVVEMTIKGNDYTWGEILNNFQIFLAGCGYIFNTGLSMQDLVESEHAALVSETKREARDSSDSL